jgi:hypothetical protein
MVTPVPSVSIDHRHYRYTPELRDQIAERLGTPPTATDYHILMPSTLRELADTVSERLPVLSLYLQLTPERRTGKGWRSALTAMSDDMLRSIDEKSTWNVLQEEFARIEQAMDDELPALGRGVAFFACQPVGLWRQLAIQLPLPDLAHLDKRPYIRPLARTRDEHDRFVIAVLTEGLSRYFISQIGQVREVFAIHGTTAALLHEAGIFAGAAEQVLARYEARYLLIAASEKLRGDVVRHLGKDTQERLGAEFVADIHARPAEIAAAAEPAQRATEEREEVATVQRLLDAGPQRSAHGVRATLGALWEHRVATLVVDDMFAAPGARCRDCAALLPGPLASCPVCGGTTIEPVEDLVELAIEETLDQDGTFEMVRSTAARGMMARIAPMAALLRW